MVVILDELSHEEQKLFGELYDERGRRITHCRFCGKFGIYLARSDQGIIDLHNMEDDSIHSCINMEVARGYYQREHY
jgi:hypothetical protein